MHYEEKVETNVAEFEQGNGPDLDEAAALEIGMSFLKARRAASELIAEAERMAREFVMTPDLRTVSTIPAGRDSVPTARVDTTEPGVLDLRNLAAQVDEIEGALVSSHERILRLFNETRSGYPVASQLVEEVASPAEQQVEAAPEAKVAPTPEAKVAPAPDQSAPVTELAPRAEPAERIASGDRPASPAADLASLVAAAPAAPTEVNPAPPPLSVPSNGTGSSLAGWGPPDPSSRVDLLAGDAVREQHAPPAEHQIFQPVPEPVPQPVPEPAEQSAAQWTKAGPVSWSAEEALPQQPSAQPPEQPVAAPTQPYENGGQPAKSSSTLWLVNVIGFSVLVIVIVVVMMLANVL